MRNGEKESYEVLAINEYTSRRRFSIILCDYDQFNKKRKTDLSII